MSFFKTPESTFLHPWKYIIYMWKICSQAEDIGMNLWLLWLLWCFKSNKSDILPSSSSCAVVSGNVGGVGEAADSARGLPVNVTFLRMPDGRHAYLRVVLAHREGSWLLATLRVAFMYAAITVPNAAIKAVTREPTIGATIATQPVPEDPAKH